jgi:hypothetical protein
MVGQDIGSSGDRMTACRLLLFEALVSGRGLGHIVNCGGEILGNPLMVCDNSSKVLAYTTLPIAEDDPNWMDTILSGHVTQEYGRQVTSMGFFESIYGNAEPVILEYEFNPHRCMLYEVRQDGKTLGLVSLLESERPFAVGDADILKTFCAVVATELLKNKDFAQLSGAFHESLLVQLLSSDDIELYCALDYSHCLNLHFREHLLVLVVRRNPGGRHTAVPLPFICAAFESFLVDCEALVLEDEIVVITSNTGKNHDWMDARLLAFLDEYDILIGASDFFTELPQARSYLLQARTVLDVGVRLAQRGRCFLFQDAASFCLIDLAARHSDLRVYCDARLDELAAYDQQHKTEYLLTLHRYLANNLDPTSAAKELSVHRNTVDYRIGRIEELLGASLKERDTVFTLDFSLRIKEYLQELPRLKSQT